MPDRVEECLINLLGITIDNEHRVELLEHKKDDIAQAKSELLKVVCECVPEEKDTYRPLNIYDDGQNEGFNSCRSQVIEAMEILFGKEIA